MNYPDSFYARTAINTKSFATLSENLETDICIIGGGLAGLTCALELIEKGKNIILLEANKVAWGASGRNGGIVFPGFAAPQDSIKAKVGVKTAKNLFDLSREGLTMVRDTIDKHQLTDVNPSNGILNVIRYDDAPSIKQYCQKMAQDYDYQFDYISQDEMPQYTNAHCYHQGYFDRASFHFHPLNYCLGLAQAIAKKGGMIFENSAVVSTKFDGVIKTVKTKNATIKAEHVVLCGGGYSDDSFGKIKRSILPIATYVVTTEHLGDKIHSLIKTSAAIIDDRRAADYYRIVDGDRLLWGGRITAKTSKPEQLAELIKSDIIKVYPELKSIKIDTAWTGLMAYARHRMPYIGKISSNVWSCTAFGGHGMNTAPIAARLISEAITKQSERYRLFDGFKLQWNGGVLGPVAAQSTYFAMKIADWWHERG